MSHNKCKHYYGFYVPENQWTSISEKVKVLSESGRVNWSAKLSCESSFNQDTSKLRKMSLELDEEVFRGREKIARKDIENFRIKGLEEISKDMKEHGDWDGVAKAGCLAFRVDRQGKITQDILHLLGASEPKRLDAKLVFGKEYKHDDHQVKVDKVDLSHFRFRGNLRSAFLGASEFVWGVWRPSKSQPGVWKEVDKADALKDGGNPIFMAAVVQPWSGARLKVDIGIVSSSDLSKEGEPAHPRFPTVGIYSCYASFGNAEVVKGTGLPTMPYIIDAREVEDEELADLELPTSWDLKQAVFNLFRKVSAPHMKSTMDNLKEALKGDWRKPKVSIGLQI